MIDLGSFDAPKDAAHRTHENPCGQIPGAAALLQFGDRH